MLSSTVGSPAACAAAVANSATKANAAEESLTICALSAPFRDTLQLVLIRIALERRFDRRAVELRCEQGDELVDKAAGVHPAAQCEPGRAGCEQVIRLELLELPIARRI